MTWPCNHSPAIVCDIAPGADLVCFNHFLERVSRLEKDRSYELNIPESVRAMKDNFCGNAARKRKKEKTSVPGQKN
jgi:hypothetical protein